MPVVLRVREAHDEAFELLSEEGFPPAGVLLHCCTIGPDELAPWVEAGCFVAFGGALTFNNGDAVRASAAIVPEDRLLTETDAPYMAPKPFRGSTCEPAHAAFTAERLAEVRGVDGEARAQLLKRIARTTRSLLDRPPTAWQRSNHG